MYGISDHRIRRGMGYRTEQHRKPHAYYVIETGYTVQAKQMQVFSFSFIRREQGSEYYVGTESLDETMASIIPQCKNLPSVGNDRWEWSPLGPIHRFIP